MSTRRVLEDLTTVGTNQTVTSNELDLSNEEATTFQFEGDNNSSKLTFLIQGKVNPQDDWCRFDQLAGISLTQSESNCIIRQYDTLDLEKIRVKTTNEEVDSTVISIIASKSEQQ